MSNHDELMCNFFAQADALAYGKVIQIELSMSPPSCVNRLWTIDCVEFVNASSPLQDERCIYFLNHLAHLGTQTREELRAEGVPDFLIPHKVLMCYPSVGCVR